MKRLVPHFSFVHAGSVQGIFHGGVGTGLPRHTHEQPHTTYCANGSCIIRMEGRERILTKLDQPVLLPANEWHEIEVLQADTVFINTMAVEVSA